MELGKKLRALQAQKSDLRAKMKALLDKEDFDEAADGPTWAAYQAEMEKIEAGISRTTALIASDAQAEATRVLGPQVSDNVAESPTFGFQSFGHFAQAVRLASVNGVATDSRLLASVPGSPAGNEGAGADGGWLVPPEYSNEITRLMLDEDSVFSRCTTIPVSRNSMSFPKDSTTPWGGSGVQAYWQSELKQIQQSAPSFESDTLTLHRITALVPVSNDMLEDAPSMDAYIRQVAPGRISWKIDEAVLFGDGVAKPFGALSPKNGGLVVYAPQAGETKGALSHADLSGMVSQLLPDARKDAFWIVSPDLQPILEGMTIGNYPIYLERMSAEGKLLTLLKGRPVVYSEHAGALGTQGDISLFSPSGYRAIDKKGGLRIDTSMHLYFDADAMAFRFVRRVNGAPILRAPVKPPKSTTLRGHFITLGARA